MNQSYLLLFLFTGLLFSCQNDKNETLTETLPQYQFVKKDSLTLDNTKDIYYLHDHHPDLGYLFLGFETGEVIIVDKTGTIQHSFNRKGRGDEEYSSLITSAFSFLDNKTILLQGSRYIKKYDLQGKFLSSRDVREKELYPLPASGSRKGVFYQTDKDTFLIINNAPVQEPSYYKTEYFTENNKLSSLSFQTGKVQSGVKHRKGSPYLDFKNNGLLISSSSTEFFYAVDEDGVLMVVFSYEPLVHLYRIPNFEYIASLPLHPISFSKKIKGVPLDAEKGTAHTLALETARNHSNYQALYPLKKWGKKSFATKYRTAPNAKGIQESFVQLFKNGKKVAQDIPIPSDFGFVINIFDIDNVLVSQKITSDRMESITWYRYALEKMEE